MICSQFKQIGISVSTLNLTGVHESENSCRLFKGSGRIAFRSQDMICTFTETFTMEFATTPKHTSKGKERGMIRFATSTALDNANLDKLNCLPSPQTLWPLWMYRSVPQIAPPLCNLSLSTKCRGTYAWDATISLTIMPSLLVLVKHDFIVCGGWEPSARRRDPFRYYW